MSLNLQKMRDYLDSEECEISMEEWFSKMEAKDNVFERRVERVAEYIKNHSLDKVRIKNLLFFRN